MFDKTRKTVAFIKRVGNMSAGEIVVASLRGTVKGVAITAGAAKGSIAKARRGNAKAYVPVVLAIHEMAKRADNTGREHGDRTTVMNMWIHFEPAADAIYVAAGGRVEALQEALEESGVSSRTTPHDKKLIIVTVDDALAVRFS